MRKYLSVQSCAEYMDVSQETVRRLLRDRQIQGVKMGDTEQARWRVHVDEIERYMLSKSTAAFIPKFAKFLLAA